MTKEISMSLLLEVEIFLWTKQEDLKEHASEK